MICLQRKLLLQSGHGLGISQCTVRGTCLRFQVNLFALSRKLGFTNMPVLAGKLEDLHLAWTSLLEHSDAQLASLELEEQMELLDHLG